ncbi:MAG TPA: ATP-dependent DNA helicase RecG [Rhodocyclaceae bacterium]|nr:ATP-dependent DNA helicase RecG [Rhodocyclaceae bacterium]
MKSGAAAQPVAGAAKPSGGTLAARLAKLGICGDADLVLHLPLRYEDETRLATIATARPGEAAQLEVRVLDSSVQYRPRRQLVCRVGDETGELILRFFSFYPNQVRQLEPGALLRVFGEVRGGFWGAEIVHPRFHAVLEGDPLPQALTPIYPTTAGLGQQALRRLIDRALERADLTETLPPEIFDRLGLPTFEAAVNGLHHPAPGVPTDEISGRSHPAWRRIKFDELLAQQLSLRKAYAVRRARSAPRLAARGTLTLKLLENLPFRLTGAQRRAWAEIGADLAAAHPMQRLLQGDVGSGKTVLAALAMLQAAENGCQAALMAPTEILAEQHYRKLAAWLAPLGVELAWLSGGMRKRDKQALAARLASGEPALAVGTHALIEEAVSFNRLGLAVVDEQHRFGVRQRLSLRQKGESPHQLMMSATPIPRTLAMSYYADLDVSVLDELPPGRTPVLTKVVSEARRDEVIARVREGCRAGRQAYWVCPLIEESEQLQLRTALETFERLSAELPELRIGLLHGRLKTDEKARVMGGFAEGAIDLLVATTVIEVGVDVPNASLMVIEHAERFGLAQLHQLRGRVGRGRTESVCILLYAAQLSETARARLKVIYESQDGFEIARRDLELRGPGEFVGSRQSGVPLLRFADLAADADLLALAREVAARLLADYPQAAEAHLARWLSGREELLKA